jgi:plasmid stabilization system protein ParE
MSLRVVFRRAAKAELEGACAWYEGQRTGLGDEFLDEAGDTIERAATYPDRHPVAFGDVRRAVLRRFPYSVYFRERGKALVVLAVFHGRRNPIAWKRRA